MLRKVVTNTSPIINLIKINKINLFEALYSKVIVPVSVYEEIQQGLNNNLSIFKSYEKQIRQ